MPVPPQVPDASTVWLDLKDKRWNQLEMQWKPALARGDVISEYQLQVSHNDKLVNTTTVDGEQ